MNRRLPGGHLPERFRRCGAILGGDISQPATVVVGRKVVSVTSTASGAEVEQVHGPNERGTARESSAVAVWEDRRLDDALRRRRASVS